MHLGKKNMSLQDLCQFVKNLLWQLIIEDGPDIRPDCLAFSSIRQQAVTRVELPAIRQDCLAFFSIWQQAVTRVELPDIQQDIE